jgi:hypothetical protein
MDPMYFALVAEVEKAAGSRAADDYRPGRGMSKKLERQARADAKRVASCAKWAIPSNATDGWYFTIHTDAAHWEGVLMPRRV